jgi:hypothetical protein
MKRKPYGQGDGLHVEWFTIRKGNLYLMGASLVALLVAGGWLYWRLNTPMVSEDEPAVEEKAFDDSARFIELDGAVKIRKAGTYEWVDASRDIALRRNDTVRTVGDSSARIRLFDGTEYLVKPDTIFIIEVMYQDPATKARQVEVKLTAGQVNVQTPRMSVAGSRSELATPTTEASFDELTSAVVGYDQSNRVSDFAIYRGSTQLRAGDKEVKLAESQAVQVAADQTFAEIINLPSVPELQKPSNLSRLVYADPVNSHTELRWKKVSDARSYHVMLDRHPNFPDPQEYRIRDTRVLVPGLSPGTYFWSVSAIDSNNREGGASDFAQFTITSRAQSGEPPKLVVPQPRVSIDGLVTLNGMTDPDAVITVNDKRVSVKPDGSFREYLPYSRPGRHSIVVKAHKRSSGGTAEKTIYVTIGSE